MQIKTVKVGKLFTPADGKFNNISYSLQAEIQTGETPEDVKDQLLEKIDSYYKEHLESIKRKGDIQESIEDMGAEKRKLDREVQTAKKIYEKTVKFMKERLNIEPNWYIDDVPF